MGGEGSGRKPDPIKRLLGTLPPQHPTPQGVSDLVFIPNHSGDHSAGIVEKTPVKDESIVNKKYVDDAIAGVTATPGGSNQQIQYNNNGAFGGTSGLTWNGTTLNASGVGIFETNSGSTLAYGGNGAGQLGLYYRPTSGSPWEVNYITAESGKLTITLKDYGDDLNLANGNITLFVDELEGAIYTVKNIRAPTSDYEAANKKYVDDALDFLDNEKLYFGTGNDASITYDGTNMVINPKEVGSGLLSVLGDILLPNSEYIQQKNTAGSSLSILGLNSSNQLVIGSIYQGSTNLYYSTTSHNFYSYPGAVATEVLRIDADGDTHNYSDTAKQYFGAGDDASITYDGTNMHINPKEVGTGIVELDGSISIDNKLATKALSPAQVTGNTNDWAVNTNSFVRYTADGEYQLTGIVAGLDGQHLTLVNVGTNKVTLMNDNASSTAANRFLITAGVDCELHQNDMAIMIYDATTARWRVLCT